MSASGVTTWGRRPCPRAWRTCRGIRGCSPPSPTGDGPVPTWPSSPARTSCARSEQQRTSPAVEFERNARVLDGNDPTAGRSPAVAKGFVRASALHLLVVHRERRGMAEPHLVASSVTVLKGGLDLISS